MTAGGTPITAGPGMGESRAIVSTTGLLDRPWGVEPTSQSLFAVGAQYSSDTAYENTLSGDGAISLLADASGVQLGGLNLAVVGNDISNLPVGVVLAHSYDNPFDLVADNSIHAVSAGIGTDTTSTSLVPASTTVGNVFRGNTITGPGVLVESLDADGSYVLGPVLVAAGISISGVNNSDLAAGLMNVIDQNTVANFRIGVQLVYNDGAASEQGSGGILDTVIANNFFSSDGNSDTYGLTTRYWAYFPSSPTYPGGVTNLDGSPFQLFGTNQWQNFWNPSSSE